jgi:hypothetical protein
MSRAHHGHRLTGEGDLLADVVRAVTATARTM